MEDDRYFMKKRKWGESDGVVKKYQLFLCRGYGMRYFTSKGERWKEHRRYDFRKNSVPVYGGNVGLNQTAEL